jgi:hypothetical protein
MSLRRAFLPLAAVVALLAETVPAAASVMAALELDELVSTADDVVIATAVDEESRWDDRGRIVTDVTLVVDEPMKGSLRAGDTFVVRHLGGSIGDLGMRVEGEVAFALGERSVVFAERRGALSRVVGMSQGSLPIRRDTDGAEMVWPGGRGLALVRQARDGALVPSPGYLLAPRGLDVVRAEILAAVGEGERR